MTRILLSGAAALALGLAAMPAAAQNIDTAAGFADAIGNFGTGGTATYGQTFTVGADHSLDSFTMYLNAGSGGTLNFRAYVYAWNGSRAVGDAIYASANQQLNGGGAFTFDTGGINLLSGAHYVAFLTTAAVANSGIVATTMPFSGIFTDSYAGGDFVYTNNGNDFASLTARDWEFTGGIFGDAQFKAEFTAGVSPVPEPAAWAMLIGGFGIAGGLIRRRARKAALA